MGIVTWVLLGLLFGAGARFALPGRAPGGVTGTILVGIGGAIAGGLIGTFAGFAPLGGFEFRSFLLAATGAIAALFVFRLYVDRAAA